MGSLLDFTELVNRHQGMVYSIVLRALGNREMAEDLTQEVFLSLHEHLDGIESEDHARNWLRRAAANKAVDEIRRLKYRRGPALDQVAEPAVDAGEKDPLLLAQLREREARALRERLNQWYLAQAKALLDTDELDRELAHHDDRRAARILDQRARLRQQLRRRQRIRRRRRRRRRTWRSGRWLERR